MICEECGVTFSYRRKGWRRKPRLCPDCNGTPSVIKALEQYNPPQRTRPEILQYLKERKAFLYEFYERWGFGSLISKPFQIGLDDLEPPYARKWKTPPGHELCGHEGCNHLVGHGRHEALGPSMRRYKCECHAFFRTRRDLERHLKAAWKIYQKRGRCIKPMDLSPELNQEALEAYIPQDIPEIPVEQPIPFLNGGR